MSENHDNGWHVGPAEGEGWPDQPSRRDRDSEGRFRSSSGGTGWPVQPSSQIKQEPEPVPTTPEALADAVIKQRGH